MAAPTPRPAGTTITGAALIALGVGTAVCAVLGPLVLDVIVYRTSPSSLHQIVGVDATGLLVVAPLSIAVGIALLRGHQEVGLLGLAPAVFAAYTYTQLVVGNEYLDLPGNVERFFPLLLGNFVLALVVAVRVTAGSSGNDLPGTSRRTDRIAGWTLLGIAGFVVVGLHLPSYLDAVSAHPTTLGYLSSPTAFWLVKFMDLGIVAPIAVTVGVGMLRGRRWARRPTYALVGGYALLGLSVVAMAVTMYVTGDPDGSLVMVLASAAAAATLVGLAGFLYRPLLAHRRLDGRPPPVEVAPLVADRRAPYAAREGGGLPPSA